jgi:molecular chaperone GrpE
MANPRTPSSKTSSTESVVEDVIDFAAPAEDAASPVDAARLQQENADLQDKLLRRAAEFQNYRRRTEVEMGSARTQGRAEAIAAILDVFDDLRRSLDAATMVSDQDEAGDGAAADALRQGVELVYRKFGDALTALGVESLQAVGHPFDETLHEAMLQQPSPGPDAPPGTVIAEVQPGYRMGDRVLRHARVVVAS